MPNVSDSVIVNADGTVNDLDTGEVFASTNDFVNAASSDISLASTGTTPTVRSSPVTGSQSSGITSFLNSAGSFGVTIASLITGRPVVVTAQGQPIGASGSRMVASAPPAISGLGTLVLLGLGVLILVKVLK